MKFFACSAIALLAVGSPALAHDGPRVWVDVVAGKVVTLTSDNDLDPTVYTPGRIFTTELGELFGIWTTEFPGYEVRRTGGSVNSGTVFGFNLTGPALYFDTGTNTYKTVQLAFGAPGPVPQIAVSQGASIRSTGGGPVAGFNYFAFFDEGDHSHLQYTLLGDGVNPVNGPTGVYAISLELTSAGLTTSDPYYILIGKGVTQSDPLFQTAKAVAEATLVSAPGDMDCNGALELADTSHFVQALLDPAGYSASHPNCPIMRGDMNQDGLVNGSDVQWFLTALALE